VYQLVSTDCIALAPCPQPRPGGLAGRQVPAGAALAVRLAAGARAEEDERAEIKRLVLAANRDLDLAGTGGAPVHAPAPAAAKTGAQAWHVHSATCPAAPPRARSSAGGCQNRCAGTACVHTVSCLCHRVVGNGEELSRDYIA
jgi:hypothetical protein